MIDGVEIKPTGQIYRPKEHVGISAVQVSEDNIEIVADWLSGRVRRDLSPSPTIDIPEKYHVTSVGIGDYVVVTPFRNVLVYSEELFGELFEFLGPGSAHGVGYWVEMPSLQLDDNTDPDF
jgi:hypothetical protein